MGKGIQLFRRTQGTMHWYRPRFHFVSKRGNDFPLKMVLKHHCNEGHDYD